MFEQLVEKRKERKLQKIEKLRIKNAKLRAQGKDPLKGWGKMVDTGGANATGMTKNKKYEVDTKDYTVQEYKNTVGEK